MISNLDSAALGALIGLLFGLANYVLIMRLIGRQLSYELAQSDGAVMDDAFLRRLRPVRRIVMIGAFGILPLVGYWAGRMFGSQVS